MYTIGPRGQVLLSREVREKLNIEPGTRAIQMVVGDHVELHFVRPKKVPSTHSFLLQHKDVDTVPRKERKHAVAAAPRREPVGAR
jgi:bifunctional DNA-binding transcriptional regulator/antitoxin component of YhaV-PrlF toxin-antitoxin module